MLNRVIHVLLQNYYLRQSPEMIIENTLFLHHISKAFFQKTLINRHKFSNECLNMEDYFTTKAKAMFIVSCH